jgi:DNA (cytosine-5)-methyltransferase 1
MYREYLRFVKLLKPKWFVFENVEGFKSFGKGQFATDVETELRHLGYETNSAILNAVDFGVPQKRNRYFIIGNRIDSGGIKFNFSTLKKQAHITVKDAVSDLPAMKNGEKASKKDYKTQAISRYAQLMRQNSSHATQNYLTENKPYIIERYKVIKEGENWKAAKKNGHLNSYTSTKNTHSGIYKRLEQNKPSVTIANYRKSMLIHPTEHRGLSLREAARLQSFPDDFLFEGSLSYQQQQVGNAVPPYLAKTIFEEIISLEKG